MKKHFTQVMLAMASIFLFGSLSYGQDDIDHIACKEMHSRGEVKFQDFRTSLATQNYDLKYYRFDWFIDPAVYQISGTATPYFNTVEANVSQISFDFSSALTIDSIKYHGQSLTYNQPSSYLLTINLPNALAQNTLDSLSISYHGVPPSGGFGSFIQDNHNGTPILWTLSEPFGAQDWWPCKNGLDDKIDSIDVIVTTPDTYRAASNGLLTNETPSVNGMKSYHWKHRYSISPYLVAIAVTNYVQYTDIVPLKNNVEMPMLNYVYPESENDAKIGTNNLVKVLQFYDSLFVDYPFKQEKYGHAQFGWGGGMEHQTMSYVVSFDFGLLAHELAHQWFGDMVTCGSWEDIWLNEGFATYLEGLTRQRFESPASWQNWKLGKVSSITSQNGGSVKVSDPTNVNRIFSGRLTYNKGSYLLHMLRWKLGDQDFFAGIRNYLHDRAYNYAVTDQLQAFLEAQSGQDLDEFFADWFVGQGFPNYDLTYQQHNDKLYLLMNQQPSHSSVSFFEMPLPFVVTATDGRVLELRIENTTQNQLETITLPEGFVIDKVQFDPTLWIVSKHTITESTIVANEDINGKNAVKIVPNPVVDALQLVYPNNDEVAYTITNNLGKLLMHGTTSNKNISVANLTAGLYHLTLTHKDKSITSLKFVKI